MSEVPANRVTLLTPPGRGAVSCLAIEGPRAAEILMQHVCVATHGLAPLETWPLERIRYCRWRSSADGSASETALEDIILVRRALSRWELHCHGGAAAARRIIADLEREKFAHLPWREWIAAHEPNPVRAAALARLADAPTERTAAILLDQYLGAWDESLAAIRSALSAGNSPAALAQLNAALGLAPLGRHLVRPWRVVLAGPPNAGKSSLLNALAGYRRAIVHDQPGTTRDRLTVNIALDGWPIELADTAGLRISDDPLETAGVARAEAEIATADAVVLVFDITTSWTKTHAELNSPRADAILVHNKSDLLLTTAAIAGSQSANRPQGVLTSATTGAGLDALIERIVARLIPISPSSGGAVPFTAAQVEQLQAAADAVHRGNFARALSGRGSRRRVDEPSSLANFARSTHLPPARPVFLTALDRPSRAR